MENFTDATTSIFTLIFALLIIAVIFLALREFWCWYFKLSKIVQNQETQNKMLKAQVDLLSLLALKNGVPDKKVQEVLDRSPIIKTVSKEWIESNREKKQNKL